MFAGAIIFHLYSGSSENCLWKKRKEEKKTLNTASMRWYKLGQMSGAYPVGSLGFGATHFPRGDEYQNKTPLENAVGEKMQNVCLHEECVQQAGIKLLFRILMRTLTGTHTPPRCRGCVRGAQRRGGAEDSCVTGSIIKTTRHRATYLRT